MFAPGEVELGVIYAAVEGANEHSIEEGLAELIHRAHALGAIAVIESQLVQSEPVGNCNQASGDMTT